MAAVGKVIIDVSDVKTTVVCNVGTCRFPIAIPIKLELVPVDGERWTMTATPDLRRIWAHMESNHPEPPPATPLVEGASSPKTYEQQRREWQEEARGWSGV